VLDFTVANLVGLLGVRTRWGSLSPTTSTITLNLELAKQPRAAVEYVLVHELAHLIDRTHGPKFQQTMDIHMPDWRHRRDQLGRTPALWPKGPK
jgi:predicted metal-dependent hydrolase